MSHQQWYETVAREEEYMSSLAYFQSILDYDHEKGIFYWKISKSSRAQKGKQAGYIHCYGYRIISIDKKNYQEHRLVWLFNHGVWPKNMLDHINGIRDDNRICNLREANIYQNNYNAKLRKDNTSGVKGVTWNKWNKKWHVQMRHNGKNKFYGYFEDLELAELVINEIRKKYHGEYANEGSK
jgi:hypothetical protein